MQTARLARFSNYLDDELPSAITDIPSMMSENERRLLLGLAKRRYSGGGVIVDAGVFLGASTMCFGIGLTQNRRRESILSRWAKPIRTFEYGRVNPGMIPYLKRHRIGGDLKEGEDFGWVLKENIAPVADLVELSYGDICTSEWDGSPIEILFLDVLKSREIHRHVLKHFYPALIQDAVVVHQDYFFDGLPWIKVSQEKLGSYFSYQGEVQSSAVFTLKKQIPQEAVAMDPGEPLSLDRQLALLDKARDRTTDPDRKFMVELSKVRLLAEREEIKSAVQRLSALPGEYPTQTGDRAARRLKEATAAVNSYIAKKQG